MVRYPLGTDRWVKATVVVAHALDSAQYEVRVAGENGTYLLRDRQDMKHLKEHYLDEFSKSICENEQS